MQCCRERIVDELPVVVFVFERGAGNVQLAVSHIADRDGALDLAASLYSAEEGRAAHRNLARGGIPGNLHALQSRGVIADYSDGR